MKSIGPESSQAPRESIGLVVCYFGPFPGYFELFLRSCAYNSDIDWLIYTDNKAPRSVPSNVHLKQTSFGDLRQRFSQRLGFEVMLSQPRKICDFRPAFGYLLERDLRAYSFWGHCDLDMIFGDLRKFLTPEILKKHDRILDLGHLSLYRNTETVNRYFMLEAPNVPGYRQVFQSLEGTAWDEWRGIYRILRYHDIPQYHADVIVDAIPPTRWKIPRFDGIGIRNYPLQVFYWYKGKIFQCYVNRHWAPMDVEHAYVHFQKRKLPNPRFGPDDTQGFLITPDGFFPYSREELSLEDFHRYNRARWRPLRELLRAGSRSLKRRLGLRQSEI